MHSQPAILEDGIYVPPVITPVSFSVLSSEFAAVIGNLNPKTVELLRSYGQTDEEIAAYALQRHHENARLKKAVVTPEMVFEHAPALHGMAGNRWVMSAPSTGAGLVKLELIPRPMSWGAVGLVLGVRGLNAPNVKVKGHRVYDLSCLNRPAEERDARQAELLRLVREERDVFLERCVGEITEETEA